MSWTQYIKSGTPIVWKSADGDGDLTLTSLATTAMRQGEKVDLGATRAARYAVVLRTKFAANPTAGQLVYVYFSQSPSATAGSQNPGRATGADAAYADGATNQMTSAGALVALADQTAHDQLIGYLVAAQRYVSPVVYNATGVGLSATAGDHELVLYPVQDGMSEDA